MKVLLVSEGKHEESGALQTLVRRLAPTVSHCEFRKMSDRGVRRMKGKGDRFTRRAVTWLRDASNKGFDALVLVIDEDGRTERRKLIEDAHKSAEFPMTRRAMGVAIQTFDAWMLADEKALSDVLKPTTPFKRQPDPETTKEPKAVCEELRDSCTTGHSLTAMYAEIAQKSDLELMAKRCPNGFAPFAQRVRALNLSKAR